MQEIRELIKPYISDEWFAGNKHYITFMNDEYCVSKDKSCQLYIFSRDLMVTLHKAVVERIYIGVDKDDLINEIKKRLN